MSAFALPRRNKGRPTAAADTAYQAQLADFCELILNIRPTLDFAIGSRGWCYVLEEYGLNKGDFNYAQTLINDCRKDGLLPLDITAEDEARAFENVEHIDLHSPEEEAKAIADYLNRAHLNYWPTSFWDHQNFYVQMMVEKIDLKNLFNPICAEFRVPLANARGNADINSRASMMRRFREREAEGQICVLLYAGDFDPAGIRISESMLKNIEDLSRSVGWRPDNLVIDRFGLNLDFITKHNLTWIENLETGKKVGINRLDDPRHPDHKKEYVQSYIRDYGVRKCEANALVVRPEAGRKLCRDAILKYVDQGRISEFQNVVETGQTEVQRALQRIMSGRRRRTPAPSNQPDLFGGGE